jgi:hypothetical protein
MTAQQAQRLLGRGYTHEVVWGYDGYTHHEGDHVSYHKSDEAAQRKAAGLTMWRPVDLREYLDN